MQTSTKQLILTIILVLILVSIVGGYIFYGMQQAKVVGEPVISTEIIYVSTDDEISPGDSAAELTPQERQDVIDRLGAVPTEELTPEERAEITEGLSAAPAQELTPEERAFILERLSQ